eukprot:199899-Hanusia_phi.AAC.5
MPSPPHSSDSSNVSFHLPFNEDPVSASACLPSLPPSLRHAPFVLDPSSSYASGNPSHPTTPLAST